MSGDEGGGDGVLLLGMGGLGCAAAPVLVENGVTRLGLVDDDRVDLSNLHRQLLYGVADIGGDKVTRAAAALKKERPGLDIRCHVRRLPDTAAIADLAADYRLLLDGSDNFATRFAANDAAVLAKRPVVHGAAIGFRGQLTTIPPGGRPCLRCLFGGPPPEEGPTCRNEGVLGPLVAEVGGLMALEAVKWLRGIGEPLVGRLLTIDVIRGIRRMVPLVTDPRCPICSIREVVQ